jgi:hypothetical protein
MGWAHLERAGHRPDPTRPDGTGYRPRDAARVPDLSAVLELVAR